jgi:transcriptional regulator with XRE-family HTH domain
MDIGKRIRDLREERGLTQRELARRAGLTPSGVGFIEHGQTRNPSAETVVAIARALGVPVEELLGEPVPLAEASQETGRLEQERLEADSPKDPQQWERVLASVLERQREVESKVGELVALPYHSKADRYQVKWALDEAQDCWVTLMLALPGSHRRHRRGRDVIAIDNLFAVDPNQWEELGKAERFYYDIAERLAKASLVEWKERTGQKAEPVPVGIGA